MIRISKFVPKCPLDGQEVSTGSDDDLAPNGQQAITRTNNDPVHGRISAATRLNKLKVIFVLQFVHFNMFKRNLVKNIFCTFVFNAMKCHLAET